MLKRLRMLDAGPNGNYTPGALVEVDARRAAVLLSGGHAEEASETEVMREVEEKAYPHRRQRR